MPCIMAGVRRLLLPVILNLLVPGAGLPILGRPWAGLSLGGIFLVSAELAIFGRFVTPASLPAGLAISGALVATVTWLLAQALLIARIRFLRSEGLPRELAILRRLARAAIRRQDYRAAISALAVAFSLDDSDVESHILHARLLSATGERAKAHRAWTTARALDLAGEHAAEIDRELVKPPSE